MFEFLITGGTIRPSTTGLSTTATRSTRSTRPPRTSRQSTTGQTTGFTTGPITTGQTTGFTTRGTTGKQLPLQHEPHHQQLDSPLQFHQLVVVSHLLKENALNSAKIAISSLLRILTVTTRNRVLRLFADNITSSILSTQKIQVFTRRHQHTPIVCVKVVAVTGSSTKETFSALFVQRKLFRQEKARNRSSLIGIPVLLSIIRSLLSTVTVDVR